MGVNMYGVEVDKPEVSTTDMKIFLRELAFAGLVPDNDKKAEIQPGDRKMLLDVANRLFEYEMILPGIRSILAMLRDAKPTSEYDMPAITAALQSEAHALNEEIQHLWDLTVITFKTEQEP
jgi:hypothetical protein